MSQLAKIQQYPEILRQMEQVYKPYFSAEIRFYIGDWLEQQRWEELDKEKPEYIDFILGEMYGLLGSKISEITRPELFPTKIRLQEACQKMGDALKNNRKELFATVKNCLLTERNLIQQAEQAHSPQVDMPEMVTDCEEYEPIDLEIKNVQERIQKTETDLKKAQETQEAFLSAVMESSNGHSSPIIINPQVVENIGLFQSRAALVQELNEIIENLRNIQKIILDQLISWKSLQQHAGNGFIINVSRLDVIQGWCESLADVNLETGNQIETMMRLEGQLRGQDENKLPTMKDALADMYCSMIKDFLVVEEQPPQVLLTGKSFGATIRHLLGQKLFTNNLKHQGEATLVNGSQAQTVLLKNKVEVGQCGHIVNNNGSAKLKDGRLIICFTNMELEKFNRTNKRDSKTVTEEKVCILFKTSFVSGNGDQSCSTWILSLPIVVIVHGNQECSASATIFWDNAFAKTNRIPFSVPRQVEWQVLAEQLNLKFKSCTGKELRCSDLEYIKSKLFDEHSDDSTVSWSWFNKNKLPGRDFTFWTWLYSIMKLIRNHLMDMWKDGAIEGFISKNKAREWLSRKPAGTFLLRFSDSELSGIAAALRGESDVWDMGPCTSEDLKKKGLADILKDDSEEFLFLYPDRPKAEVLSKYCSGNDTGVVKVGGYFRARTCVQLRLPRSQQFASVTQVPPILSPPVLSPEDIEKYLDIPMLPEDIEMYSNQD